MKQNPTLNVDLTEQETCGVRKTLGREPNKIEWGMLDIMFSEHCSYKSSRPLLKGLPSKSKRVVVGPGYDSGVVDVGDGYVVAFKVESHNHPSAIDPYNGAATGIGGIIRDILCTNCRPIALLDLLRFGDLKNKHCRWLFKHVVRGIAEYGNSTGIPTVAGEVSFDNSFETNCLVNVACVGVGKRGKLTLARMDKPGDYVVLVGGSTGRDGIRGVTFASKTISEESEFDRPAVQIGDPFAKKVVIEATLEAAETGFVRGIKDLGGGGLTCALSEMSNKGGTGVEVDLGKVHVREEGMTPLELMLSESQERMVFVVEPEGLKQVLNVFDRWELPHSVIGRVTETGKVVVRLSGKTVAELPSKILAEPPIIRRRALMPRKHMELWRVIKPKQPKNLTNIVYRLLSTPNIASKEYVFQQYDHEVGIRTVVKPGEADAAVLRLLETDRAIAVKADCNSRFCYLDPFNGHAGAVAEVARNVVSVGAEPIAVVDGCNFGNPEKPEVFWQFSEAIRGMVYMLRGLRLPCVGGNVSFYNEDEGSGRAVKPTSIVMMLGLIENLNWISTMAFKQPGNLIIVVGRTYPEMGGSVYYNEIHGIASGKPPRALVEKEKGSINTVKQSIREGCTRTVHDCSIGGLAVALALMAVKGGLGARVNIDKVPKAGVKRLDELLFSESNARFVLAASENNVDKIVRFAKRNGVPAAVVGEVENSNHLSIFNREAKVIDCLVDRMQKVWSHAIPKLMGEIC